MKIRVSTMLPCTHGRVRCTMPSSSLRHSAKTQPTTRRCSPRTARSRCRCLPSVPRNFSAPMADQMQFAASNVTGGIVPNSGHWIMEENPQATIELVTDFLAEPSAAAVGTRVSHSDAPGRPHSSRLFSGQRGSSWQIDRAHKRGRKID